MVNDHTRSAENWKCVWYLLRLYTGPQERVCNWCGQFGGRGGGEVREGVNLLLSFALIRSPVKKIHYIHREVRSGAILR